MNRVILPLVFSLLLSTPLPGYAQEIVINFVGDIMLAGSATGTLERWGYDYPFAGTVHELKSGDLAVGNLEAPIARGGTEFANKQFRFKASPAAASALKRAGFSILTLANNHLMDFGAAGLTETLDNLGRHGILYAGAGQTLAEARQPAVVEVKGKRVAFLAYSLTLPAEFYATANRAGTAPGYGRYYAHDIRQARTVADYVIVSFHWGAERAAMPKAYQVEAAHRAIDAGADLVIGHHPHVLQGIETYRGKVIFYSLGNFAFGSRSPHADRSIIARVRLDGGSTGVEIVPLNVLYRDVRYRPAVLTGTEGATVIAHLNRISKPFGTLIRGRDGQYALEVSAVGPVAAR